MKIFLASTLMLIATYVHSGSIQCEYDYNRMLTPSIYSKPHCGKICLVRAKCTFGKAIVADFERDIACSLDEDGECPQSATECYKDNSISENKAKLFLQELNNSSSDGQINNVISE